MLKSFHILLKRKSLSNEMKHGKFHPKKSISEEVIKKQEAFLPFFFPQRKCFLQFS